MSVRVLLTEAGVKYRKSSGRGGDVRYDEFGRPYLQAASLDDIPPEWREDFSYDPIKRWLEVIDPYNQEVALTLGVTLDFEVSRIVGLEALLKQDEYAVRIGDKEGNTLPYTYMQIRLQTPRGTTERVLTWVVQVHQPIPWVVASGIVSDILNGTKYAYPLNEEQREEV